MSPRGTDVRTYGPTLLFWVVALVALAWGFVSLDGVFGWGVTGADLGYGGLIFALPTLIMLLAGYRSYRIDARGMRVTELWGTRFAAWEDLSGVTARQVKEYHHRTGLETVAPETFFYVRDLDGRIFSTVGPWIRKRREFVYESRRRIRAALGE